MSDQNRGLFIYLNQQEVENSLERMQQKAAKLEKQMADIGDKSSPEFYKLEKQLKSTTDKIDDLSKRASGKLAPSMLQIEQAARKAWNELQRMPIGTAEYKSKMEEFNRINDILIKAKSNVGAVGKALQTMSSQIKTVAAGVIIGNTVEAGLSKVQQFFSGFVGGAAKVSDELADIEKVTTLTTSEVRGLNKELGAIDTRTTTSKLRSISVEAGKLGIDGVQSVRNFVTEANQIDVALGEDLGEGAITKIGKVAGIFDTSLLKIGSGINDIGQKSSANEAFVTDFLFRLAGVGPTVKIAAGDLLGFGAVLDINGAQVEASSTALQNFFIDFAKNSEKFGKVVGFTKGELQKLIDEKGINAAFLTFLKRLKETSTSSDVLLRKLEAMDIDGTRGANTFLVLANNIAAVEEQQKIANAAIEEGSSITNEYEKRNNNLAATIAKIEKEWSRLTSSGSVQEFLNSAATGTLLFVKALSLVPGWINENKTALEFLLASLIIYYRQRIADTIATVANTVAEYANAAAKRVGAIATGAASAATASYSLAVGVLTGQVSASMAATLLFNRALNLLVGSFGGVLTLLTAVVAGLKIYYENTGKAAEFEQKRTSLTTDLNKALAETDRAQRSLNESVAKYNELSEEQRNSLRLTILQDLSAATKKLEEFKNKQSDLSKSGTPGFFSFIKNQILGVSAAGAMALNAVDGLKEGLEASAELDPQLQKLEQAIAGYKSMLEQTKPAMEIYNEAMRIQGLNAEDLELKITLLEKALKRAINPSDIETIRKALEAAKSSLKNMSVEFVDEKKMKEAAEKAIKLAKEVQSEMEKLGQRNLARQEEEYQLQIRMLAGVYEDARLAAKKDLAQGIIDQEAFNATIIALDIQHTGAKLALARQYADGKNQATEDVATLEVDYKNKVLDEYIRVNAAIAASDDAGTQQQIDNARKIAEARIEALQSYSSASLETNAALVGLFASIGDQQISDERRKTSELKEELKKQTENGTISREQYNNRILAIDEKQRKKEREIKKRQFIADKFAKVIEIGVNTAVAISKANPNIPLMVLAGVTGALQAAAVIAQPVPEFGKGNRLDRGMKMKGPAHTSKHRGLHIINPETQQLVALAEGREWIVNATSSEKYDPLIDGINRDDTAAINQWFMKRPAVNLSGVLPAWQMNYSNSTGNPYDDERLRKTIHNGFLASSHHIVDGIVTGLSSSDYVKSRRL